MHNSARPRRILAFEPYDGGSHRAVRESISRHSRHEWRWLTRPARGWKWRMRLGALEMLEQAEAAGEFERPIDVIFATSLMSLADLVAGLPSRLRGTPTILYMHENQVAYPHGHEPEERGDFRGAAPGLGDRDVHFALTNLTSILSADRIIFNSEWNRRSFIEGIERVLAHAPDGGLSDVAGRIECRSEVIWPPVEPPPPETKALAVSAAETRSPAGRSGGAGGAVTSAPLPGPPPREGGGVLHNPTRVVWPHRWEHDKGPDELLELADRYSETANLRWIIVGRQFRCEPPAFAEFRRRWHHRIDHIGFESDRSAYWDHLRRCDWVLSTARHEFFGIAVVEALLAGCLPWLPDRLSYPELLPREARGLTPLNPPPDGDALRLAIAAHLEPALAVRAVGRLDDAIIAVGGGG